VENDNQQQPAEQSTEQQNQTGESPYRQYQPPEGPVQQKPKRRKKLALLLSGVVLLGLLLAGGAYYWFVMRDDGQQPSQQTAAGQEQGEAPDEAASTSPDPTPTTYKSEAINVELTHRKDWKVQESGDGEITLTSPRISYTRVDGESTSGVFTLKIRKGVPEAMQATINSAVAPRDSEVIAYVNPTEEQRQYTNLSYAGQENVFNFFVVTGNTEFKTGNAYNSVLPLGGEFYLIVGGYGSDDDGTLSFDAVPVDSMESTALTQAIDIVESLKIY
jgi:type II secretory pathway pseudopilin PulG